MKERALTQRDRIFRAVLEVLGDSYSPLEPTAPQFYPVNSLSGVEISPPGSRSMSPKSETDEITRQRSDGLFLVPADPIAKFYSEGGYAYLVHCSKLESKGFQRGPLSFPFKENPRMTQLVEMLDRIPRNAIFESMRRDPRLNGGKKRKWRRRSSSQTIENNSSERKHKDAQPGGRKNAA